MPNELVEGDVPSIKYLETIFGSVVSVILSVAAIVLFVILLVGGFRWLTSGGDPKAVEAARGTISSAIAGLVILLLAFIILQVIEAITGVDVTIFKVTQ